MTKAREIMTPGADSLNVDTTIAEAAEELARNDVGAMPVCNSDGRLQGMVTDRDIVVRGVAQEGELRNMKLVDVMSANVRCAREGDDVDQVLGEMAEAQIRRLPVVDAEQKLVGIVTLGDIAAKNPEDEEDVAMSLGDISSPAEPDRSNQSQASGGMGGGSASEQFQGQRQGKAKGSGPQH